jgi:hypothetical protein
MIQCRKGREDIIGRGEGGVGRGEGSGVLGFVLVHDLGSVN